VAFFVAWGWLAAARAETCPDVPDYEVAMRRSLAKEWFAKAEEAEAAGDKQAAVRRYACSLNLAPHPSTAYNLGTVAEKSGDLSMAVDGFRSYIKLSPEATDRPAIEARIATLEAKIAELRKQIASKPAEPVTSVVPPAPNPAASVTAAVTPPPPPPDHHGRRVGGWITLGSAAATLATGVAFNMIARGKMESCFQQYAARKPTALDRCDEAKPFAYGSYALFGATGALGIVGAVLLFTGSDGAGGNGNEEASSTDISLVPSLLPTGGAALTATGRF
jgi:tetratricopeptide (TPR) repeat protein